MLAVQVFKWSIEYYTYHMAYILAARIQTAEPILCSDTADARPVGLQGHVTHAAFFLCQVFQ